MRDDAKLVTGNPPNDYDYRKFADILNRIETFSTAISSTGPIRISELYTTNLATSGTDLKDGQVWNNGGLLVVNPFDAAAARTALGVPADSDLTSVVTGPASSVDGHIPVFNGTTGKVIEDGYSPSYFQQSLADIGSFELGANLTGDRYSYIDFHSDDTNTDFSARFIRSPGVNGELAISNYGTGAFTYNSNTIWHSGNFTPANYAPLASPSFANIVNVQDSASHYGFFQSTNSSGQRAFYLGWGDGGTVVDFVGDTATTLNMTGWTAINTSATLSATAFACTGASGSFYINDRSGSSQPFWQWYASGGTSRFWASNYGDVLTISLSSFTYLGNTIWHSGNYPAYSITNVASTVPSRDSAGDIQARLFRSEYTTTSATIASIMTQQVVGGSGTNNYIRPSTPQQVMDAMGAAGFYSGATQDNLVFPVGHIVYFASSTPARNASITLYLFSSTTLYSTNVSGTALSGTWRAHGADSSRGIAQRTA